MNGCRSCGVRCDRCEDRMCSRFGPEPQPGCGLTCADCPPCDCAKCVDARWDAEIDRRAMFARDARAEA